MSIMNENTARYPAVFYDMTADLQDMATATAWMSRGRCAEIDPELFFPDQGESSEAAKQVCQDCPVKKICLAYALDENIPFGVWGGLSAADRDAPTSLTLAA